MRELKERLAKKLITFLENQGIEPIYGITIISILITLSYWKDFKNWKDRPGWIKGLAGTSLVASIIFSIMSLLRFLNFL